jgi:hypothetical protein
MIGHDAWKSAGHSLVDDESPCFLQRWKDEHVGKRVDLRRLVHFDVTKKVHLRRASWLAYIANWARSGPYPSSTRAVSRSTRPTRSNAWSRLNRFSIV